jgi:hypothetical protein
MRHFLFPLRLDNHTHLQICPPEEEKNIKPKRRKKKVYRSKKGKIREQIWTKTDLLVAFLSVLQVTASEEKKKGGSHFKSTPSIGFACGGACTPPVAAARGADTPPLFRQFQKAFPAIPGIFGVYFVNLKLFNVLFV